MYNVILLSFPICCSFKPLCTQ